MPRYADGFVIPITQAKLDDYRRIAKRACRVWLDHGALDYKECIIEDPIAHKMVPFPKLIKASRATPWCWRGSSTSRAPIAIASTPR